MGKSLSSSRHIGRVTSIGMKKRLLGALCLVAVVGWPALGAEERAGESAAETADRPARGTDALSAQGVMPHPSAVRNARPLNTCFGGFHHGKLVVGEEQLHNARMDTTLADCVGQGGSAGWLPRFAPDRRFRLS